MKKADLILSLDQNFKFLSASYWSVKGLHKVKVVDEAVRYRNFGQSCATKYQVAQCSAVRTIFEKQRKPKKYFVFPKTSLHVNAC